MVFAHYSKVIKKLLKPTPTEYWEHPESVIKRLIRCPIVNEKTHLNLEYLSVPHPGTSKLSMDQVFLLSKRPLRGVASVEEKIGGQKTEEQGEKRGNGEKAKIGANQGGGRPSVLLDRNTHIATRSNSIQSTEDSDKLGLKGPPNCNVQRKSIERP